MVEPSTSASPKLRTLDHLDGSHERILVRADFNVPLADGQVADDTRIRAALPTIRELLSAHRRVILMSHLGRPKGVDDRFRMAPVGARLSELLGQPVLTLSHVVGAEVQNAARAMGPGEVLLLENLRFERGEAENNPQLAGALAALADAYVFDAFGVAHRAAASTVGVAQLLPAYVGRLVERELSVLSSALEAPERPFVVVLGGAKVSDKLGVVRALAARADRLLIGGGMANTFLAASGVAMGDSLVEADSLAVADAVLQETGEKILLPVDLVVAERAAADAPWRTVNVSAGVPSGWLAVDIGPTTVQEFAAVLADARTVVWNGPLGLFEAAPFAKGTVAIARCVADLDDALTVVGGGDTVAAVAQTGLTDRFTWVSTGGGATLRYLEGGRLPAIDALRAAWAHSNEAGSS